MKKISWEKIILSFVIVFVMFGVGIKTLAQTTTTNGTIALNTTVYGGTGKLNTNDAEIYRYSFTVSSYSKISTEFTSMNGFLYARLLSSSGTVLAVYSPKTYGETWYSEELYLTGGTYYFEIERKVNTSVPLYYYLTIHSSNNYWTRLLDEHTVDLALNRTYTLSKYIDTIQRATFQSYFYVREKGVVGIDFENLANGYGDLILFNESGIPQSRATYLPKESMSVQGVVLEEGLYYLQIENAYVDLVFDYNVTINFDKETLVRVTYPIESTTIAVGDSIKITSYYNNEAIGWTSSNNEVASTTTQGFITAKKEGTAIMQLVTSEGAIEMSYSVTVVTKATNRIQKLELDKTILVKDIGDTFTLNAIYTPANVVTKNLVWSSQDENVATVTNKGKVTILSAGSSIITVKDKITGKVAACEVFVGIDGTQMQGIVFEHQEITLEHGDDFLLNIYAQPSGILSGDIMWYSTDPNIASVDSEGFITGESPGTAIIIAYSKDVMNNGSNYAYCTVNVENIFLVERIKLNVAKRTLYKGDTYKLKATALPVEAGIKAVTYKTSNKKVAKVNKNGKITALKKGIAVITVTSTDGSKITAKCKITVK